MIRELIKKIGYSGKEANKYNKYIYYRAMVTVLRGVIYSLFSLKCKGFISIDKNVSFIGPKRNVIFGRNCKVEKDVLIQSICYDQIIFGDNVTICQGVMIRPTGYWNGQVGSGLNVGNGSSIGACSYIGCSGNITIGKNVMIGPNISIIAENHIFDDVSTKFHEQGVRNEGVCIKDNVWIGTKATILDGVTIESNSIIAAGSVVTKNVPSDVIVAGVPARIIRHLK